MITLLRLFSTLWASKRLYTKQLDIVHYLISKGADLDIKDANGCIALGCAKMTDHWEVIQALEKDNDNTKFWGNATCRPLTTLDSH